MEGGNFVNTVYLKEKQKVCFQMEGEKRLVKVMPPDMAVILTEHIENVSRNVSHEDT